jgi:uncharacterized protein
MLDLYSLNMEKGLLYETIVTTCNQEGTPNAAPIGVICKDQDTVVLRLNEGSRTVRNIQREKAFYVNLTRDPMLFFQATVDNPPFEEFKDENRGFSLENADGSFLAEVIQERQVEREDSFGKSVLIMVQGQARDIMLNKYKYIEPMNRALCGIIEALVNLSRMEIASSVKNKEYLKRMKEISSLVNRVGGKDHRKAMKLINEEVRDKIIKINE